MTERRTIDSSDNPAVLGGVRAKNNGRYNGNGRDWRTPPEVFGPLDAEFSFTLDPCSTDANALCDLHFTEREDGLAQDWGTERVYMNPPYGAEVYAWTAKARAAAQAGALVVGLLPASTDLRWWHDDVVAARAEVRYIRGRVRFLTDGPYRASGFFASVIVIWRPPPDTGQRLTGEDDVTDLRRHDFPPQSSEEFVRGWLGAFDLVDARAEATAAAEQRLRERIGTLPVAPMGRPGRVTEWVRRREVLALLDTPPPASPRQGEPVGLDVAWSEAEAALIAAQGDDDGFGVEIAYWSEFPDAPWSVAANGVQIEAPRLPDALRNLAARLSDPAEPVAPDKEGNEDIEIAACEAIGEAVEVVPWPPQPTDHIGETRTGHGAVIAAHLWRNGWRIVRRLASPDKEGNG